MSKAVVAERGRGVTSEIVHILYHMYNVTPDCTIRPSARSFPRHSPGCSAALASPCRGLCDSVSPGRGVGLPLLGLEDPYPALLSHCRSPPSHQPSSFSLSSDCLGCTGAPGGVRRTAGSCYLLGAIPARLGAAFTSCVTLGESLDPSTLCLLLHKTG